MGWAVDVQQTNGCRNGRLTHARRGALQPRKHFQGLLLSDAAERHGGVILQWTVELRDRRDRLTGKWGLVLTERFDDGPAEEILATADAVMADVRPGDLILTMGAGDITDLGKELVARLERLPGDGDRDSA